MASYVAAMWASMTNFKERPPDVQCDLLQSVLNRMVSENLYQM